MTNQIRDLNLKFGITIYGLLGEGKKSDQTKAMVREKKMINRVTCIFGVFKLKKISLHCPHSKD